MAYTPLLLPRSSVALLSIALLLYVLTRRPHAFVVAALCAALICSWRGHEALQVRLPESCNRQALTVMGEVASLPRVSVLAEDRQRQRFEFTVRSLAPAACFGPSRILLSYYGNEKVLPGQTWRFDVLLRRPWGLANPGSFNMQSWYARSGIDAIGAVRAGEFVGRDTQASMTTSHHRLRQRLSTTIDAAGLSVSATAVLKALTVADKSGLNYRMWSLLQYYGINHLLVVSGLHIALVSGLAFLAGRALVAALALLRLPAAKWPWAECTSLAMAIIYAAMAGFSVATMRALIMLACFLLAQLLHRRSGGFNSLLLAAFVLLLINPLALLGSGFWLSFSAVAALLWLNQWRQPGLLARVLVPHFFMALVMVPLGTLWFGGASWISAPVNLLMIPLVGLFIVPLSLMGAVFSLLGAGRLALALWELAAWPVDVLWPLASVVAERGGLFATIPSTGLGIALGLLGVMLIVLPLKLPARGACGVLLLPLFVARPDPALEPQLNVLDVGQGTAVVFTMAERALLYDTGGGNPAGPNMAQSVVLPWLRFRGISSLEVMVISHNDQDHSAGATNILAALPVATMWQGELSHPAARRCIAGMSWQWPGLATFQFLGPAGEQEGNDASCVLMIEAQGLRFLLAGDIGVAQERELIRYWGGNLNSDVLLVGHHGSGTSSSQAWLNHVSPSIAVIAAGYASRFGHPHDDVMTRLLASGAGIHQTALEGALTLAQASEGALDITGHREGYQPWWM
ncbi:MAG: DNA internalization-related competence protein ComEC/Rec2 [Halioglobus sp.]